MKRLARINVVVVLMLVLAACTSAAPTAAPTAVPAAPTAESGLDQYGERYDADPALLTQALGTSEGVPQIALAAIYRAGLPVDDAMRTLAIKCWKDKVCDTGSGGELTLAIADGFGENVWREITHMEAILQALTYPEIGRIMYSSARYDTQTAISDIRSFIAQDVDIIIGYPDGGDALLPAVREATERGIPYVPYAYGKIGEPGTDYLTFVGEDVCVLGQNFAAVLNQEVGTGKVAFLGGTPGNPLSAAWQACEEAALGPGLELIGRADTNWTREGALQAVSGFISSDPDLKGISYEYADGFLGGLRAYEAAGLPLDIVLTLRTDEVGLFCEWADMNNPNFKIFYSAGGNFQSRIALTAAMMNLKGYAAPAEGVIVPARMRQVDESSCNRDVPGEYPVSSLVPIDIVAAMYP
ncbi:MAG TPA: substrate-binding domain-containing protein [Anaerolineae bacterium]